jgi:hypothetical protein
LVIEWRVRHPPSLHAKVGGTPTCKLIRVINKIYMKIKIVFLFLLYFFCTNNIFAQKNLVTNASFEEEFESWINYGAQSTPWVVKKGKTAAAIVSYDDTKWLGMHQEISLPKNAEALEISIWMKADAIQVGNEAWKKGIINVDFLIDGEKKVGESVEIGTAVGTIDWTNKVKYMLVPKGAKKCKIIVAIGFATGTLFVDEFVCKVISKEIYDKQNVETKTDDAAVAKPINYLLQSSTDKKIAVVKDLSTDENEIIVFANQEKDTEKQQWIIKDLLNGYYKIISVTTKKAMAEIGNVICQRNWMGEDELQWKIIKSTKGFNIVNKVSKKNLIIENNTEWIIEGFKL